MSHMEAKSSVSFWDKVECHILRQSLKCLMNYHSSTPAACDQLIRYLALRVGASGICLCFLQDRIPYRGKFKCHLLGQGQVSHIEAKSIITD